MSVTTARELPGEQAAEALAVRFQPAVGWVWGSRTAFGSPLKKCSVALLRVAWLDNPAVGRDNSSPVRSDAAVESVMLGFWTGCPGYTSGPQPMTCYDGSVPPYAGTAERARPALMGRFGRSPPSRSDEA